MLTSILRTAVLATWAALCLPVVAQTYTSQPVKVVVGYAAEVQKALQTAPVCERMTAVGGEAVPVSTEMFANLIHSERLRYDKLVREAISQPD
jgi:tripartite-type tricarboxylate transporter receptor subunit TctC